jgi:hypothetical protein
VPCVATRPERVIGPVDGHRTEPAQTVGTAAGLINAPDLPLAGKDGVVRAVLVDAAAEPAGRSLRGIGYLTGRTAEEDASRTCFSLGARVLRR